MDNKLWVSKYRPKTLSDICLPERLKKRFESGEVDANLLLGGHHGTGKTTLARILASNHSTLILNGSDERSIDTIRKKVIDFCSTNSMLQMGKVKVVLFDEAEKLTKDAQDALKATIEKYESNARFLFTSNHPERLSGPLHSRFEYIPFSFSDEENIELKGQYLKRLMFILKEEGYSIEQEAMMYLVNDVFPDLRKMTVLLYSASRKVNKGEKITLLHLKDSILSNNEDLYEFICSAYKPEDIFMKIKGDYSGKELDALKSLGEPFLQYLLQHPQYSSKVMTASMVTHKYNYEVSTGDVDPLLTLLACCGALSQILK